MRESYNVVSSEMSRWEYMLHGSILYWSTLNIGGLEVNGEIIVLQFIIKQNLMQVE